jgi:lipopolysaccharide/colanic/teichoic acid biosynthesis glycosyltransferase
MRLVAPRPVRRQEVERCDQQDTRLLQILQILPGMTDLTGQRARAEAKCWDVRRPVRGPVHSLF